MNHTQPAHTLDQAAAESNSPFNGEGRINRITYLAWHGVVVLISLVFSLMFVTLAPSALQYMLTLQEPWAVMIIGIVLNILLFFIYISFAIKRLHDVNQSGWLSILILIPIVNFFFSLYLLFMPGTATPNNYGQPRPSLGWELVLGWMMIIFICIAILTFMSIFLKSMRAF